MKYIKNVNKLIMKLPASFIHDNSPPIGYYYEAEEFKRNVIRIWLCNTRKFDYNNGAATKTIHSFYNTKTKEYFSPINSKTIGARVNIKETRNYTAMPIKQSPLEAAFV